MKIPVVIQMRPGENGAAALCMMLGAFRKHVPLEEMREVCVSSRNGSSPQQMIDAARRYGLAAELLETDPEDLKKEGFPLLVHWKRRYWCIIRGVRKGIVSITDPAKGEIRMTWQKFCELYCGQAIRLAPGEGFVADGKRESLFSLIRDRLVRMWRAMIVLSILTAVCVLLNFGMIRMQKDILDVHMGDPTSVRDAGRTAILIYALALLAYFIFSIVRTRLINAASRDLSAVSGSRLFKKMFRQPLKFFEQYSAGELMSRIENNVNLDHSIIRSLVPRGIDAVMTVIYLIALIRYNWIMALACFGVVVINLFVTLRIQERNAIAARSMTTSGNVLNTAVLNGMSMIETIKSTGSERAFYNMWKESLEQMDESKLASSRIGAAVTFLSGIHSYVLQAIQLFLGAYFVLHGQFTLGSMALFQGVLTSMITSMTNCMNTVNSLQTMRTNIERVDDIMHRETRDPIPLPPAEYETADKLQGTLSAQHLTYRYNAGDRPAIDDVSIEVAPGRMIAIVGRTGCGKSTLLKVLADLYEAESGEIRYAGKRRSEIPDVVFHSSVMVVDQDTMMFEDSVYNNIRMWDGAIENYEVILAARDAQIHDRILRDRRDYGAQVEENGRNFSGGELQRLELARALAHEPTLLFLDEFTSALDALTEDRVIQSIREKGTTCVIVAHRLSTIVDCDRIYVMDEGRVVQAGTHEELYAQSGLYRELITA